MIKAQAARARLQTIAYVDDHGVRDHVVQAAAAIVDEHERVPPRVSRHHPLGMRS